MKREETIKKIRERVKVLPLVEESVNKILALLNDPESNYNQIAEQISPGVAAEFLNMANTASTSREIRSLTHAIKLIGYEKMERLLSTSVIINNFAKQSDFDYFSFDKFHRQAHFCAVVAVILGQIVEYESSEDLYTASILLNIGKLIIAIHFKDEHLQIIELKKSKAISTREAEEMILGASHAEIGALALKRLKIPKDICDAVRYHNSDDPIPEDANYQMIMISREASRIVGSLRLPDKVNLAQIIDQLHDIIQDSRNGYRKRFRAEMRLKGYIEFFPELLNNASAVISEGMKEIFRRRARLSVIAKNREG